MLLSCNNFDGYAEIPVYKQNAKIRHWQRDRNFRCLIAAIDMFLSKFPSHCFAKARLGTIVSKFKNCSALMSYSYMDLARSRSPENMASWLWTRNLQMNYANITKPGQELSKTDSYMPYFMDLGLADKSPYSAFFNPDLHLWIHCIGCASFNRRSFNAYLVGKPEFDNVLTNAQIAIYVFQTYQQIKQQFVRRNAAQQSEQTRKVVRKIDTTTGLPCDGSPISWNEWLMDQNMVVPEIISKISIYTWRNLDQVRKGTISEFLKTYAANKTSHQD